MVWARRIVIGGLAGGVSLVVGAMVLVGLMDLIEPQRQHAWSDLARGIDFERLFSQITVESVGRRHGQIVRPSSRLAGSEGDRQVSAAVEEQMRRLGLQTLVQRFPVTVPVTKWCDLEHEEGGKIADVQLLPFWPNLVRTCTTGPDGIVAEVVDAGTGSLEDLAGIDVRGKIALVTMTRGPTWLPAANLGASAILFRESEDPAHYAQKVLRFPAHMPRFLARGDADQLVGRRVRIRARVDWESRESRNVFGVIEVPGSSASALVLLGHMDAWSVVPDLAPGYYEGCSATALMEIARVLADQRDGLGRTVIFAALSGRSLASEGSRRLLDTLGGEGRQAGNITFLERLANQAEQRWQAIGGAVEAFTQGDYWALDDIRRQQLWKRHGQAAQAAFGGVVQRLVDDYVSDREDQSGAARVAWVQAGQPQGGPRLETYLQLSAKLRRARAAAGADVPRLRKDFNDVLTAAGARAPSPASTQSAGSTSRLTAALVEALAAAESDLNQNRDALATASLMSEYRDSDFFFLFPSATGQRLAFTGFPKLCADVETARNAVVRRWLGRQGKSIADPALFANHVLHDRLMLIPEGHRGTGDATEFAVRHFALASHKVFAFWGTAAAEGYQTPRDEHVALEDLTVQTQLLAAMAGQMASSGYMTGRANYPASGAPWFFDYGGQVLATGGTNSILPDRPMARSLAVLRNVLGEVYYIQKTHDGSFRFPAVCAVARGGTYGCDAYRLDADSGEIRYARDLGLAGQRFENTFDKRKLARTGRNRVTVLVDRFDPTDIYGLVGAGGQPLTAELLHAQFRTPPDRFSICEGWEQGKTLLSPPGQRFYVILKDLPRGSYSLGHVVRWLGRSGYYKMGFLLGHDRDQKPWGATVAGSFWGDGYLAGEDRRIIFPELDAAMSVAWANDERVAAQGRQGLGDPVTGQLSRQSMQLLSDGQTALQERRYTDAYRDLMASLAISMRAYPSVRSALADALLGILLYMFFMLPFSYFAERLLVGANDIRPRLFGAFAIFLLLFLIIRITHPAYEMVSNPLVVLVAFTIFTLSLMILGFLSGRFALRMRELRAAGGGGTEADTDISRSGAAATAFDLGVNGMRKRPVRTAYTLATLVLISFSMFCFTTPQSQLVQRQMVQGPGAFNGMLLREYGDLAAARTRYGDRAQIVGRRAERRTQGHEVTALVAYQPPRGQTREAGLGGLVYVQSEEAAITEVDKVLLPGGRWFERNDEPVCYLSDITASQLGIRSLDLGADEVYVQLRGQRRRLLGVFDSAALDALRDIDGESFLPELRSLLSAADIQQQRTQQAMAGQGGRVGTVRYLPASQVAILPLDDTAGGLYHSAVVKFGDLPYGQLRDSIESHMVASPTFFSFALDGRAFFGGKIRSAGLGAIVDLVVPLMVACCIVFNTMLGSVHQRQREISVYSALGLSPRHVFYLFLAEALVFAVLGGVGGYLLGLGLQWVSHQGGGFLGWTVDYSSRNAIYVWCMVMGAVLASSFVPARRAARIASPSQKVSWRIPPEVAPGKLAFELPFTYQGRDVLAVVPFLLTWFDAHGEDASSAFTSSPPTVAVDWTDGGAATTIAAKVWLRPYDLGVSQDVAVSVQPSRAGNNIFVVAVTIDLYSGAHSSWQRTNVRFVGLLRRHLLSWRALSPRSRQALFERGANTLLGQTEETAKFQLETG